MDRVKREGNQARRGKGKIICVLKGAVLRWLEHNVMQWPDSVSAP